MDNNEFNDINNLSEQLDKLLQSDSTLNAGLESDNELVQAAAELTKSKHPELSDQARADIWSQVEASIPTVPVQSVPQSASIVQLPTWLVNIAAIFVVAIFGVLAVNNLNFRADTTPIGTEEVIDTVTEDVETVDTPSDETPVPSSEPTDEEIIVTTDDNPTDDAETIATQDVFASDEPEIVLPQVTVATEESSEAAETIVVDDPDETTATGERMYIFAEGRVNIRGGAGTNFDILGVANQNTPVTVLGSSEDGDWIQIRLPNGLEGWVAAFLLDDTPGRSGETTDTNTNNADADTSNSNDGNGNSNGNGQGNGNSNGNANGGQGNGNSNGNANGGQGSGNSNGNANGDGQGNGNSNGNANGGQGNGNSNGNANGGGQGNGNSNGN